MSTTNQTPTTPPDVNAKIKGVLEAAVKLAKESHAKTKELQAQLPTTADAEAAADTLIRHRFLEPSFKAAAVQHLSTVKGLYDTLAQVAKMAADAVATSQGAALPGDPVGHKRASADGPRTDEEACAIAASEISKLAAVAASQPTP